MSHYFIHCQRNATSFLQEIGCNAVNTAVSPDIMFVNNKHRRYYELFQPVKPYKGEPPTLAGKDLLASVLMVFFPV